MVYFVRARKGGSFWLERPGPGWPRHECDKLRRRTKLRIAASAWRHEGWLPLGITSIEVRGLLKRVYGLRLDGDGVVNFDVGSEVDVGPDLPVLYRIIDPLIGTLEIDYLDSASGDLSGKKAVGQIV
jgi:hypothetical protein